MNNYTQFIQEKGSKEKIEGWHRHHIIPKSAGGTDDPDNLVYLRREDHAWAHILYDRIYDGRTCKVFLGMLSHVTGSVKPWREITYEDCKALADYDPIDIFLTSEAQKRYWADPEKRAYRTKKFSEAKIGKVNVCVNRKWVNNGVIRKRVNPEEVKYYLSQGFKLGIKIS